MTRVIAETVDLRSDTVTLPTPEMREAMAQAEVGDDVYGEDPTVNRLEDRAARMLGKQAALFVPSGTMANLLALMSHCPRGRKVLVGDRTDLWLWEAGGAAVLGGLVYHPLPTQADGTLAIADLESVGDGGDAQCAPPGVLCLENTHCLAGGRALPLDYLRHARAWADGRDLPVHLDGARLFNAAVATGVPVDAIAATADSVSFCLSKGLGAPVGSMLAGAGGFVAAARRLRKMLGGGMRQAGVLAAAGLVAIERGPLQLATDHAHAQRLAAGLDRIPGLRLVGWPETNIVLLRLERGRPPAEFLTALEAQGVRMGELVPGLLRAVTHRGIGAPQIDRAVAAARRVLHAVDGVDSQREASWTSPFAG